MFKNIKKASNRSAASWGPTTPKLPEGVHVKRKKILWYFWVGGRKLNGRWWPLLLVIITYCCLWIKTNG